LDSIGYSILNNLAFSQKNLSQGMVWTLVSALFIHSDPTHLFGNMFFLFVFGNTTEKELGAKRTLIAFFAGGITSFLLSLFFFEPTTLMIGASAAIFTLTAIVMLVKPLKFSFLFFMPQGLVAIIYFIYNIFAVYLGFNSNISYISHVIGFVLGFVFGLFWSKEWKKNIVITFSLLFVYLILQIFLFQLI
jgi:membrane associated rhomboid family serine protease